MKIILLFFLGASIGSFLGLVIDRFPHTSLFFPASHCNHCKKSLKVWDLVPIFSQVSSHSKCRYCHAKIPYWYALVEISCALLVLLAEYNIISLLEFFLLLMGLVLSIYDIKHREYPLLVWLVFTFLALLFSSLNILFLLFLLLALVTELFQWKIGAGDFLFLASFALLFSATNLLWVIQISSLLGILVFHVFRPIGRKLPFIPFLLLGSLIVLVIF